MARQHDNIARQLYEPTSDFATDTLRAIIVNIMAERKLQDEKWGEQNHAPTTWTAILTEECGEVAKEALTLAFFLGYSKPGLLSEHLKKHFSNFTDAQLVLRKYEKELTQVAAVAIAMMEHIHRRRHD